MDLSTESPESAKERQIVVFSLGDEWYGVDIASVREIIVMQKITPVPRTPEFVQGIINLRGRVIPVLDLRKHFGFEPKVYDEAQRIMVTDIDDEIVGVVVDSVLSVMRLPESAVEPPSPMVTGPEAQYLIGIAKTENKLIVLLDMARIINDAEKRMLKEMDLAHAVVDEGDS